MRFTIFFFFCFMAVASALTFSTPPQTTSSPESSDSLFLLGQRLFRETRFAEFYAKNAQGDWNKVLEKGDPSLQEILLADGTRALNPYAGKSMNCASCHFSQESAHVLGARSFSDFSRRSFVPFREEDQQTSTLRNSPGFIGALPKDRMFFLHMDGEFLSAEDLVLAGFSGRNFGWLAHEKEKALSHILAVLRADDGSFSSLPPYAEAFRVEGINIKKDSDEKVLSMLAKAVTHYMAEQSFQKKEGLYSGSAYDAFLALNHLPQTPAPGESDLAYAERLKIAVEKLEAAKWVEARDLPGHTSPFVFGAQELQGLKIFLQSASATKGAAGNCFACHTPPHFTDFSFHNIGVSQVEYDFTHEIHAFQKKAWIPSWAERESLGEDIRKKFAAIQEKQDPGKMDLGLWNFYGNPKYPQLQQEIEKILCAQAKEQKLSCEKETLLALSLASFKTPGLRNLGLSAPYMHNGEQQSIEDAVAFYLLASALQRKAWMRNPDKHLAEIRLMPPDVRALSAFLKSLNE